MGLKLKRAGPKTSPIIFSESQERRNLTLVKRRRRRRDFLPFEHYFMQSCRWALYVDTTSNLRKMYVSEIFHNIQILAGLISNSGLDCC